MLCLCLWTEEQSFQIRKTETDREVYIIQMMLLRWLNNLLKNQMDAALLVWGRWSLSLWVRLNSRGRSWCWLLTGCWHLQGVLSLFGRKLKKNYRSLFCSPLSRYVMQLCISVIVILLTYQLVRTGTSSAGTMARQSGQVVTSPVWVPHMCQFAWRQAR